MVFSEKLEDANLEIKAEVTEDVEELHHSIDIKDEYSLDDYQLDQVGQTQICKQYKCGLCNVVFTDECRLAEHVIVHTVTEELLRSIDPGKFSVTERSDHSPILSCKMCNYKTYQTGSLVFHMKSHLDEKCKFCNCKCSNSQSMVFENEKLFSCGICNFQCPQRSILKIHRLWHKVDEPEPLIHDGEKPFYCLFCDFKSSCKNHFRSHLSFHTDDRQSRCSKCYSKCTCKCKLEIQPFSYGICKKRGKRQLRCGLCKYRSAHQLTLQDRLMLKHFE